MNEFLVKNKLLRILRIVAIFMLVVTSTYVNNVLSNNGTNHHISTNCRNSKVETYEKDKTKLSIQATPKPCLDVIIYNDAAFCIDSEGLRYLDLNNLTKPDYIFPNSNLTNPRIFARYEDKILINSENSIFQLSYQNKTTIVNELFKVGVNPIKMKLVEDKLFLVGNNWFYTPCFLVYDITESNNPELLANTTLEQYFYDMTMNEKYVYVFNYNSELIIYELMDDYHLKFISRFCEFGISSASLYNGYLYICEYEGLKIYKLLENKTLNYIRYCAVRNAKSIFINGNIIYLVSDKKLILLNQTKIENMVVLDTHTMERRLHFNYEKVIVSNNFCVILNDYTDALTGSSKDAGPLTIFDISNTRDIVRLYPDKIPLCFDHIGQLLLYSSIFSCPLITGIFLCIFRSKKRKLANSNDEQLLDDNNQ